MLMQSIWTAKLISMFEGSIIVLFNSAEGLLLKVRSNTVLHWFKVDKASYFTERFVFIYLFIYLFIIS